MKLDSAGNFLWAKAIGGSSNDRGYAIAVDSAGNVHTAGWFSDQADFDPGLGTFNLTAAGGMDGFTSKLDSAGNFVWAKRMGGPSDDHAYGIAVDSAGNLYTTGGFYGTVDFDPGPSAFNLTAAGGDDIFITKLDSAGSFVWAKRIGGQYTDFAFGIGADRVGNVYTTGAFYDTVDFDPGPGTFNLFRQFGGSCDIFVSKLSGPYPIVTVITRCGASPTHNRQVAFTVRFSVPVTDVDVYDFMLDTTGAITGAEIADVTGSGSEYTVTIENIEGDGTLRLDLMDDDSILDGSGNPLGGPGFGNGDFTTGETYDVLPALPVAAWPLGLALSAAGAVVLRRRSRRARKR
jgi:hypothetical protein